MPFFHYKKPVRQNCGHGRFRIFSSYLNVSRSIFSQAVGFMLKA
nr:MAG TPA: hypothetical protein [Caudoviricetes sp.]